jgi:type VI secretion system secreted protein VgrG
VPDQAHVDAEERVQVQFDWGCQGEGAPLTDCWLPVAGHLQGVDGEGRARLRVGMAVVVSFLQGDADKPLVTGCLVGESAVTALASEKRCIEASLDPRTLLGNERSLQIVGGPGISFEEDCRLVFQVGNSTLELDGENLKLAARQLTMSLEGE